MRTSPAHFLLLVGALTGLACGPTDAEVLSSISAPGAAGASGSGGSDGGSGSGTSGAGGAAAGSGGTAGLGGEAGAGGAAGSAAGGAAGAAAGAAGQGASGEGGAAGQGAAGQGGGGAGGQAGSGPQCGAFPAIEKGCTGDQDCSFAMHNLDCCGSALAVGFNKAASDAFAAAETTWASCLGFCACLAEPPIAEDGNTLFPGGASVACMAGQCKTYVKGAGALAPRPLTPQSTSTVTSQKPLLRWVLPAGSDGARVELCHDRACTQTITSFDVIGTSGTPDAPLAPGVVFWRLTASNGGVLGNQISPVWQFTVGHGSAAVDTSSGTTLDINGDGFADVVVGNDQPTAGEPARVYVFLGGAAGVSTTPSTTLTFGGDSNLSAGIVAAKSAGDVNGDGFADLVVSASFFVNGNELDGTFQIYLGSAAGLAATPSTSVASAGPNEVQQYQVASAGDVNGDGFADVIVGAAGATGNSVQLYLGGPEGLDATPAISLSPPDLGLSFGGSVAGAGDVNGDGFSDVVVGDTEASGDLGAAYVYLGGPTGPAAAPTTLLVGMEKKFGNFGKPVASAGDVNGDGFSDIVVTDVSEGNVFTGKVHLYLGGAEGIATAPATSLAGAKNLEKFGDTAMSAGDVNADGFDDLVVTAPGNAGLGSVQLFLGGPDGLATTPATLLSPTAPDTSLGRAAAAAGDVNGDGFADLVVSALEEDGTTGVVYVYLGTPDGFASTPVTLLTGSTPGETFGATVASLSGCSAGPSRSLARRPG
jgi:hypothetical protein